MNYPNASEFETTFSAVCMQALLETPDTVVIQFKANETLENWTTSDILRLALNYIEQLLDAGIQPGQQVAVMLDNHPDHVATMIALSFIGAIWVPLDRRYTAANIRRVLTQADTAVCVVESEYTSRVRDGGFAGQLVQRGGIRISHLSVSTDDLRNAALALTAKFAPKPDDVRALLFTSGTTGPPKGVIVTERMFIASALFCGCASEADSSTVFYLWEPLNHIGGAQIVPMALLSGSTIAMSKRFSVTRFWSEVIEMEATRIHYLGGVLELLLRSAASSIDRQHQVTLGFGAGASEQVSRAFTSRFGVPLREVYGMTEASSFTTINFNGPLNSIGTALPDFELILVDENSIAVETGKVGEIRIKPTRSKLVTPGYYNNPSAYQAAMHNGFFRTGDLAKRDSSGNLYFVGRQKELIRCKGENVSAWEIESVFKQHECVLEAAVIGVDSDVTEQDIAAYIRLIEMENEAYLKVKSEIKQLLKQELASFQQPKYVIELTTFPKTPSERIEKHKLNKTTALLNTSWTM